MLYRDVALELRHRRTPPAKPRPVSAPFLRRAREELPMQALQNVGKLALFLRQVTGRDVIDLNRIMELIQRTYALYDLYSRHARGDYETDEFGFDREWTESLLPFFQWLYESYWRVEASGIGNVPGSGRALLVSNHAGVLPWDGAMIKVAILSHHPQPRHARALVASWFFTLPVLSWFLRRTGQTVGHPEDTDRLLAQDELVLVFPEGVKGTGKPFSERYRLRRFGRGGFIRAAIRAQAPIIPISVVGSEEIYPMLADLRPLAQMTGFPYFPVTLTWPHMGPLGFIPLPSKWLMRFHTPVRTDLMSPEDADDQALVLTLSDQVRDTIQDGLYQGLMERKTIFW